MSNINQNNTAFSVDDFESLLQKRQDNTTLALNVNSLDISPADKPRLQSERGATLYDLIRMISEIVTKATKKRPVIFSPDEGVRPLVDQAYKLDKPYINYSVISRKPILELKPRERAAIYDEDAKGIQRKGRVWGQKFDCLVQFDIFAGNYEAADSVMNLLEELIFDYTSYFKRNGVGEILFSEQITDRNLDMYREHLSVRSLRYRIIIEKLHVAWDELELTGILTD